MADDKKKKKGSPVMRVIAGLLLVIAAAVGGVWVYGSSQPEMHTSRGSETIAAKLSDVFALQADVPSQTQWRSDLKEVKNWEPGKDGKASWTELWKDGRNEFKLEVLEFEKNKHLKLKIDDENKMFYGTWTYEFEEVEGGTKVTITENGGIPNPFFRGMYNLMNASDKTLKAHLADLKAEAEKKAAK